MMNTIRRKILVQCYSDMHLEMGKSWPRIMPLPNVDLLILAGDIGKINMPNHNLEHFLRHCSTHWPHVVYVPGNHEFYHQSKPFHQLMEDYRALCSSFPNVHFLSSNKVLLPLRTLNPVDELDEGIINVPVYGFICWTEPIQDAATRRSLADYHLIHESIHSKNKATSPQFFGNLVEEESKAFTTWLSEESSESPCLVVSHFPPLRSGVSDPKYEAVPNRMLNNYFSWPDKNLYRQALAEKSIVKAWFSGHTHWSYSMEGLAEEKNVRFISNQMGYNSEYGRTGFKEDGIFEIEI